MTKHPDWLARKDFDEGLRWFSELVTRTREMDRKGQVDEVIGLCKKAIPGGVVLVQRARSAKEEFSLCQDLSYLYVKLELFGDAEEHSSRATELDISSFRASLGLYLVFMNSGKTKEALEEIWRYARHKGFSDYRVTIEGLVDDLRRGNLLTFRLTITALAEKVGLSV
jgi:hypothetical protein